MRVLCIDDDSMNQQVVKSMLTVVGVEMIEAADAETGIAAVAAGQIDAVLMDLRMPYMDGLEAIRRLRARAGSEATVPILVVTADLGLHVKEESLSAGADDVLFKPVAMTKLFDALGRVIVRKVTP